MVSGAIKVGRLDLDGDDGEVVDSLLSVTGVDAVVVDEGSMSMAKFERSLFMTIVVVSVETEGRKGSGNFPWLSA